MDYCDICKSRHTWECEDERGTGRTRCDDFELDFDAIDPETKTNADRIRSMSDEELAGFLFEYGGSAPNCAKAEIVSYCKSCRDCWLNWLKQEVET